MTTLEHNHMMAMVVSRAWERHAGHSVLTEILHAARIAVISVDNKSDELSDELGFLRELAWARVEQHQKSMDVLKGYLGVTPEMLKRQAS